MYLERALEIGYTWCAHVAVAPSIRGDDAAYRQYAQTEGYPAGPYSVIVAVAEQHLCTL